MSVDLQTVSAVVFFILLSIYGYHHRKKMDMHGKFPFFYFSMYRTKLGLEFMDVVAKKARTLMIWLGYAGIVVGFLGMIAIAFLLVENVFSIFTKPEATAGAGLVLPFNVKGVFYVPFWYWIISIFIIALIHELAHGVIARAHNIKVKTSGFAFIGTSYMIAGLVILGFSLNSRIKEYGVSSLLSNFNPIVNGADFWIIVGIIFVVMSLIRNFPFPVIPAAFVEPDEKVLVKRPHSQQLSVFAAGPFSNVLLAVVVIGLMFAMAPLADNMFEYTGVEITGFIDDDVYPAQAAGISEGEIVKQINGEDVMSIDDFTDVLVGIGPGGKALMTTDEGSYDITLGQHPDNEDAGYLGVYVQQDFEYVGFYATPFGTLIAKLIAWLAGLFRWLVILNIGIGLFNLLPLGPLDGGRMFQLVVHKYFGKKKGNKIWYHVSLIFLAIVVTIILFSFLKPA